MSADGDRRSSVDSNQPMSAVDFLDQWFETDVLKATMSASGIIGTFLGVRSPGTAYVLLHHYMVLRVDRAADCSGSDFSRPSAESGDCAR